MKMRFIGKNGSMGFKHGRVYDVVVTINDQKNISLRCDELKVRCPYGSMYVFLENWERYLERGDGINEKTIYDTDYSSDYCYIPCNRNRIRN